MSPLIWLSPGDPHQRTGGFLYNARMVQELGVLGVPSRVLVVEDAWPLPYAPEHAEILDQVPDGATVIADGLLWTGLESVERARLCARCRVWVVIHSPLDKESSDAVGLAAREASAVAEAYGWWATSEATGRLMAERLGEKPAVVVVPGTDSAVEGAPGDPRSLLAVGHLTRRKNHRLMLDALAQCLDLEWTLRVVGSTTRSPETAAELKCAVGECGLQDRVHFLGELDGSALKTVYLASGLLLHTADYEAYGMVLTEALAHGLPIMSRPAGALEGLESPAVIRIAAQAQPDEWARNLRTWLSSSTAAKAAATAARTLVFPSWRAQAMVLSEHLQT